MLVEETERCKHIVDCTCVILASCTLPDIDNIHQLMIHMVETANWGGKQSVGTESVRGGCGATLLVQRRPDSPDCWSRDALRVGAVSRSL